MISIRIDNKGFSTGAVGAASEIKDRTLSVQESCRRSVNYQCFVSGRAVKRRGTKYIKDIPGAVRLIPYQLSFNEAYALCFTTSPLGGGEIAIVNENGEVSPRVEHDYTEEEITLLQYAQYRNLLTLCTETKPPKVFFLDTTLNQFKLEDYDFIAGATRDENEVLNKGIRSDVYRNIGATATLTASSAAIFEPGMEGGVWAITEPFGTIGRYAEWQANQTVTVNSYRRNEGKVYICTAAGTTKIPPTHDRPGENVSDGSVRWLFLNRGTGYIKLTEVVSSTVARGTIQIALPPTITTQPGNPTNPGTATTRWNEGAFSDYRGYPISVSFFAGRSIFAKGNRIEASQAGDVFNFDTADGDATDAASIEISADRSSKISWVLSADRLLVGSQGGIFPIGDISPDGFTERRNISDAVTDSIKGVYVNNRAFFMDFSRSILKTAVFYETNDSFLSQAVTTDAEEYVYDVTEVHGGQQNFNKVYMLRGDGDIAVQQFDLLRDSLGLFELEFSRDIESMCVTQENTFEHVYLLSGTTVSLLGSKEYPYLDYWTEVEPGGNYAQYVGKPVYVASQNEEGLNAVELSFDSFQESDLEGYVVPAGFRFFIGEPYEASMQLLRPSVTGEGQKFGYPLTRGSLKEMHIAVEDTQELRVNGYDSIIQRKASDLMDNPAPEVTETLKVALTNDISKPIILSSPLPLSSTVLFYSIVAELF